MSGQVKGWDKVTQLGAEARLDPLRQSVCGNSPRYVRVGFSGQLSRGSENPKAPSRLLRQVSRSRLVEGSPPTDLGDMGYCSDGGWG